MKRFLTAEWRSLLMANYRVSPDTLTPYLPASCSLESYQGNHYISLVAFRFLHTKVLSLPIPGHRNFDEVNIRFYVVHKHCSGEERRGVVFIKEYVPRAMIAFVARTIFKERYVCARMQSRVSLESNPIEASYAWKTRHGQAVASCAADVVKQPVASSEAAHFFSEHYHGYTQYTDTETLAYEVAHEPWQFYPVLSYKAHGDWEKLYPEVFSETLKKDPESVFLFEGSPVSVSWFEKVSAS